MKHNSKNIPQGYKDSPLGVIPEGWQVKRLGEIAEISSGGTPLREKPEYWNGNIPWVTTSLINQSAINYADEYITEQGLNNSAAKILEKGTLLMAMYGQGLTRGKISKLNISAAINQACAALKINQGHADYIFYALDYGYEDIRALSNDGGQKNLSLGLIKEIKIILPSLGEQERIAEILGTWDRAIELQGRKVALLQSRKRALMQQLLTPHRRLPNFSEPWKTTRFKDIFQKKHNTPMANDIFEILSVTKDGIISQKEHFNKEVASDDTSKYLIVEKGDFAMSGLNFWMGSCHVLTRYKKGIISPAYKVFSICKSYDIGFITSFVKTKNFIDSLIGSSVVGASVVRRNLDKEMLMEWTYKLPCEDEQRAIAEVLTTADREIELATQNLTALRTQKRALMQQLLTGKKQVKI